MRTLRKPTRSFQPDKQSAGLTFKTPMRSVLNRYRAERAAQMNNSSENQQVNTPATGRASE